MVRKVDGPWQPSGDFRRLNLVTVADSYPLPNMLDFASKAAGCTIFQKCHQILVHPADIQKTVIMTPFGAFEYLRMPFGLTNAGATFQRKIDRAFADLEAVFAYVNDMDVARKNTEQHAIHLRQLFTGLREHGLVLNAKKCVFGSSSMKFLGHHLSPGGGAAAGHVAAVVDFPRPSTVKELQGFLGMVNFLPPVPARGGKGVEANHQLLEGWAQGGHHHQLGGQHGDSLRECEAAVGLSRPVGLPRRGGKAKFRDGCSGDTCGGLPAAAATLESRMGAASFFFIEAAAGSGQIFCI
jgi:hypothetical protein